MLMKVSLKLAAGCKEEEMAELLAVIPGVQLVGQRSSWLNYRYRLYLVHPFRWWVPWWTQPSYALYSPL